MVLLVRLYLNILVSLSEWYDILRRLRTYFDLYHWALSSMLICCNTSPWKWKYLLFPYNFLFVHCGTKKWPYYLFLMIMWRQSEKTEKKFPFSTSCIFVIVLRPIREWCCHMRFPHCILQYLRWFINVFEDQCKYSESRLM